VRKVVSIELGQGYIVKQQYEGPSTHPDLSDEFPSFNVALELVSVHEGLRCLGLILDLDALDEIGVPFGVSGEVEELLHIYQHPECGRV
jgi:hypothetical protein